MKLESGTPSIAPTLAKMRFAKHEDADDLDLTLVSSAATLRHLHRNHVARLQREVELPVHSASAQYQRTSQHIPASPSVLSVCGVAI